MTPWAKLTALGQKRRLGEMARTALSSYDLDVQGLKLIFHGENATFRVSTGSGSSSSVYRENTYLLRLHGRELSYLPRIESEMAWLQALREDEGLAVPEPVLTRDGALSSVVEVKGYTRPVTVMKWLNGKFVKTLDRERALALGRLMGRLHRHSQAWERPEGFFRDAWDWEGLFGERAGFEISAEEAWRLVPEEYRSMIDQATEGVRRAHEEIGRSSDVWGLVHADLHEGNVLYTDGEARPIDFDDSREAPWVYDFAVALNEYDSGYGDLGWLSTVVEGYEEEHSIDRELFRFMPTLMAGRQASLMLWVVAKAQVQPEFQKFADRWFPSMGHRGEVWLKTAPPVV